MHFVFSTEIENDCVKVQSILCVKSSADLAYYDFIYSLRILFEVFDMILVGFEPAIYLLYARKFLHAEWA